VPALDEGEDGVPPDEARAAEEKDAHGRGDLVELRGRHYGRAPRGAAECLKIR
jgi:hypothetical protein